MSATAAYDVVLATRNRANAISLSLPRLVAQAPAPAKVIVVDASDDPAPTRQAIERTARNTAVPVIWRRSPAGLTCQRNLALGDVTAPIVFFPDDDSIVFPGFAAALLEVYAHDEDNRVGGVCGVESPFPPSGFGDQPAYRMERSAWFRQQIARRRTRLERRLFTDPFVLHGRAEWRDRAQPGWMRDIECVPVEWMTGFRMSFRTDAIQAVGFDQVLADYGLFEDIDASFGVLRRHLVVGAHHARVFHFRAPGVRGDARALGATQILNRAYVVCKHSPPGSAARQRIRPYAGYKCLQYGSAVKSARGRARLAGAVAATRRLSELLEARPERLAGGYARALAAVVQH